MNELRETYRLGVVPYLNVQPLIAHLSTPLDNVEIVADVPSKVVRLLDEGAVDIAIVPVFALLDHPDWSVVPGVGIASDGLVQSVLVLSDSPLEELSQIHLDPASMTSSALAQVLLRHHWRRDVTYVRRSRVRMRREPGDGYLVIGDRALRLRREFKHALDLGEAWRDWSGLPFVYAVWAVRSGVDPGPLAARLANAPSHHSPALFEQIAREHHRELGLSVEDASEYLRERLRYRLGREEMLGLRHYLNACQALGFGPRRKVTLRILARGGGRAQA